MDIKVKDVHPGLQESVQAVHVHHLEQVGKIEEGDVEETYAHAVAALTGNDDVVNAVSRKTGVDCNTKSTHVLFASNIDSDDDDEAPSLLNIDDVDPADDGSDYRSEGEEEGPYVKVAMAASIAGCSNCVMIRRP